MTMLGDPFDPKYRAFLIAWHDLPTENDKRCQPDRGSFGLGFSAAWDMQQLEIERLKKQIKRLMGRVQQEPA